jgi:hypothetical protein
MMKDAENTEGTVSSTALKLAEQIRQTGRRSPQDLLPLIEQADRLAATTTDLAVTAGASGYLLKDSLDSQERPTDLPGLSRGLGQRSRSARGRFRRFQRNHSTRNCLERFARSTKVAPFSLLT